MEFIKKRILQAVTKGTVYGTGSTKVIVPDGYYTKPEDIYLGWTGDTGGEGVAVIPDLSVVYNIKISLTSEIEDIGFFNAYDIEPPLPPPPPPPPPPEETFYYEEYDDTIFTDSGGEFFEYEEII